jgi:hypothetical protein
VIQVEGENGFHPEVIAPGAVFRRIGLMRVRYDGREVTIDNDDEYAIWNDGTFGPQRRSRNVSGVRF